MTDDPYRPPKARLVAVGILSGRREDLRKVATYQKGIMICILGYFLAGVAPVAISDMGVPNQLRIVLAAVAIAVALGGMLCVLLLSTQVYGGVPGFLLAALTLVPCLGLIVLLLVNSRATAILKENGVRVGLLGANMGDI